ncbi:MAG TPA: phenol hydroxylase subunit [Azospirillum sp.]
MARRDTLQAADPAALDYGHRFVRVTRERPNGLVEFDFAIGDPDLFLEMILTREAFTEFCIANKVDVLPPRAEPGEGATDWDWRMADATRSRFR